MAKKIRDEEVVEDVRASAIETALANLKKKYGQDVIMESDTQINVETIPTGCYSLDWAFGCGGLPRGRIIELFGKESSGKSTLSMFLVAQVQKRGGLAALIDAEFAFDSEYAKSIGVDVDKLMVSQPTTLEEAADVIHELVKTKAIDIIIIDSVASLVPKSEVEGTEMLKATMGVQAQLLNKALRILTGPISKSKTSVIFINQVREKVGVVFGNPEYTPGGKALKFYSSVRIQVKPGDKIEDTHGQMIGNTLKVKMVKNKTGFPWREAEFPLYFGKGIDLHSDALSFGVTTGVIVKSGNTFILGDVKLGVGQEKAKDALVKDPELFALVKEKIDAYIASQKAEDEKAKKLC